MISQIYRTSDSENEDILTTGDKFDDFPYSGTKENVNINFPTTASLDYDLVSNYLGAPIRSHTTDWFTRLGFTEEFEEIPTSLNLFDSIRRDKRRRIFRNIVRSNFLNDNIRIISRNATVQLRNEIEEMREYIKGYEGHYNYLAYNVILPVIFDFNPLSIDIKITIDNTLFISVIFKDEIQIELESFVFNLDNDEEIRTAYTISNSQEDLTTRLCSKNSTSEYLNNDLNQFLTDLVYSNESD